MGQQLDWQRLGRIGAHLLLILLVVPFLIFGVPQIVGANHSYIVLSGSMEPTLHPGDVVIVQSVPAEQIHTGDIITFTTESGQAGPPTTHRVTDVVEQDGQRYFRTKGDANANIDPQLVPARNVHGQVWFHIPWIGHIILFARSQVGLVVFAIGPAVLLILSELTTLGDALRNWHDGTTNNQPSKPKAQGTDMTPKEEEE